MKAKRKKSPRLLAELAGEITYATGKPCKRGHMAPRFTSNASCKQCQLLHLKAAYRRSRGVI